METKGMIQQKTAEVAKAAKNKTIKDYIRAMEGEIAKALPSVMTPERFTRITLSAQTLIFRARHRHRSSVR